jgi:hypothetical protein
MARQNNQSASDGLHIPGTPPHQADVEVQLLDQFQAQPNAEVQSQTGVDRAESPAQVQLETAAAGGNATKANPKIAFKMGGISKAMQRIAAGAGLEMDTVRHLGEEWRGLCESWIQAEAALAKLGGALLPPNARAVPPPASLISWSINQHTKTPSTLDFSNVADEMTAWWAAIRPNLKKLAVEEVVKADWCRGGLTGIMLILVGMKEGLQNRDGWRHTVGEITAVFKAIPTANDL